MSWPLILLLAGSFLISRSAWQVSAQTTVYIPTAPCVGGDCLSSKPPTSPSTDATTTASPGNIKKTVVFINKQTNVGQDMFILGGIDATIRPGCDVENAETSPCAISISVNSLGNGTHYAGYNAWRVGDTKLDWYGSQVNQGAYNGKEAAGTPMAWTTNIPTDPAYQILNIWGPHYWMTEMDMDCSEGIDEWFEVKAFLNAGSGWEGDIKQGTCTGPGAVAAPYTNTTNHLGRCGYVNVYKFGEFGCYIGEF